MTLGLPEEPSTYLAYGHVGALAEATFADWYFFGAGPLLAFGLWLAPTGTASASTAAGHFPGLEWRRP